MHQHEKEARRSRLMLQQPTTDVSTHMYTHAHRQTDRHTHTHTHIHTHMHTPHSNKLTNCKIHDQAINFIKTMKLTVVYSHHQINAIKKIKQHSHIKCIFFTYINWHFEFHQFISFEKSMPSTMNLTK